MNNLVRITEQQHLPANATASDTADWYRLGDAVEKHGRHMKRQAVAAEYNSGRNMADWYRETGLTQNQGEALLAEAKGCGMKLPGAARIPEESLEVSQALPTSHAVREYAKAEPEVKEIIKEIIREDPEAEIKAAEIKKLRDQVAALNEQAQMLAYEANEGRVAMNQRDKLREQLEAVSQDTSTKDLEEARAELDSLYNSIVFDFRKINLLSTKVFTHNDPAFISKVEQALEANLHAFRDRAAQIILEPLDSPTSYNGGAAGSEVRVLDITHVH
jgi:DNA repair exonuclease SbcCD ATPase subunit